MKPIRLRAKLYTTVMSGLVLRIYYGTAEIANVSREGIGLRSLPMLLEHDTAWYQVLLQQLISVSLALASATSTFRDLETLIAALPEWARVENGSFGGAGGDGTELIITPMSYALGAIEQVAVSP